MDYNYIHFLIEDESGRILVEQIMKKYRRYADVDYFATKFRGIGGIPKDFHRMTNVKTGRLLSDLPMYLRGLNASMKNMVGNVAVFVVLDSDNTDCRELKDALIEMYRTLKIEIRVFFCIAVEEIEAWLLGDREALNKAYPKAKQAILQKYLKYEQDHIVGTWERLADIVHKDGAKYFESRSGEKGKFKCECAERIGDHMNIMEYNSPSFHYFIRKLDEFCTADPL